MAKAPDGELTRAWTSVEAALPRGWRMMGVVRGPRATDPEIEGQWWLAWACGPKGERAKGTGPFPQYALGLLAADLLRIRHARR
jgi:hypothetical protein